MHPANVEDLQTCFKVKVPDTKTKLSREFVVTAGSIPGINLVELTRKYVSLRPLNAPADRLFLNYRKSKCTAQAIGINTIGDIPRKIAQFLNLAEPKKYTGHCFRRSSASWLADAGADISVLKRHGGWRSNTVAEGYVENSLQNKVKIARQIMGEAVPEEQSHLENEVIPPNELHSAPTAFDCDLPQTSTSLTATHITSTRNNTNTFVAVDKFNVLPVSVMNENVYITNETIHVSPNLRMRCL